MSFQVSWYREADGARNELGVKMIDGARSLTIGREDGADIVLPDSAVSRLHAEVFVEGDGVHIRDAKSANGTRLGGRRVEKSRWLPGEKVVIGSYMLVLSPAAVNVPSEIILPRATVVKDRPLSRIQEPPQRGRIQLGSVFDSAKQDNPRAVQQLFEGFLGRTEEVVDCGYLGAIGLFFPEHSFWCVTNTRVCGLLINRAGWVNFQFGFIKSLNLATFNQPSLLWLWICIINWALFGLLILGTAVSSLAMGSLLGFLVLLVLGLITLALTPAIAWLYQRYEKAGCVFWTQEQEPIWIPSDRHRVQAAQRFIGVFMDQRQILE